LIAGTAAFSLSAQAAEPVRHVGIYVRPYYESAQAPCGTPPIFMERLPAKAADRKQALGAAHALPRSNAARESACLRATAKLRTERDRNGADDKYCWKS